MGAAERKAPPAAPRLRFPHLPQSGACWVMSSSCQTEAREGGMAPPVPAGPRPIVHPQSQRLRSALSRCGEEFHLDAGQVTGPPRSVDRLMTACQYF